MKILLISATYKEVEAVVATLETRKCLEKNFFRGFVGRSLVDVLITGIGAVATTEVLTQRIVNSNYDIALNAGICGSFNKDLKIGTVVNIISEIWGDLGVEDHENFLDLFDLKMIIAGDKLFTDSKMINQGSPYSGYLDHLKQVNGITVNKSHGNAASIEKCIQKYNPDVESMESAAIFSLCISKGINFQCLRSISNFVEPRNRANWEIEKAIQNLTKEINKFISVVCK